MIFFWLPRLKKVMKHVIHEEFFCHIRSAETTEAFRYGQVIGMQITKKYTQTSTNQFRIEAIIDSAKNIHKGPYY